MTGEIDCADRERSKTGRFRRAVTSGLSAALAVSLMTFGLVSCLLFVGAVGTVFIVILSQIPLEVMEPTVRWAILGAAVLAGTMVALGWYLFSWWPSIKQTPPSR